MGIPDKDRSLLAEFDDVEIPCLATATSHLQVRLR